VVLFRSRFVKLGVAAVWCGEKRELEKKGENEGERGR